MIHISEVLEGLPVWKGMCAGSAGTETAQRIDAGEPGKLNPAIVHRQEGGRTGPMGKEKGRGSVSPGKMVLVWTNPAMTKATGSRTSRAALVMIG